MVSALIVNSLIFPIYERTEKYTKSIFLSGVLSGFIVAPIVYTFDVGKIKNQTLKRRQFHFLCFYILFKLFLSLITLHI